jgi:hypothetical protein
LRQLFAGVELGFPMKNAYTVVQPFRATTAISGRDRQFLPGEAVLCDPAQAGETVIIEVGPPSNRVANGKMKDWFSDV